MKNSVKKEATATAAERRSEVIDKLILSISQGKMPWEKCWESGGFPVNGVSGKAYRGFNAINLMFEGMRRGFSDPRWMTFQQAKSAGWMVKKGAKSEPIFYASKKVKLEQPFQGKIWWEWSALVQAGGQGLPGETVFMLKYSSVFNAEEVEGIPALDRKVLVGETLLSPEFLEALAEKLVPMVRGGGSAYLNGEHTEIHMPRTEDFLSLEAEAGVILHEYVHATGVEKHLNRDSLRDYHKSDSIRGFEEVVAESGSAITMASLGLPYLPTHAAYVQSWAKAIMGESKKDKEDKFLAAIRQGQEAADYIMAIHDGVCAECHDDELEAIEA